MIDIGDYRLRKADQLNWTIEEKRITKSGANAGEIRYAGIGYFPKLEQAAYRLLELAIPDCDSVTELVFAIETAAKAVSNSVIMSEVGI